MRVDWYSWNLRRHHPLYLWLWLVFWVWCFLGPLVFEWRHMNRYILTVMIGFAFLGWATWSKPGGRVLNRPPKEGTG